MKVLCIGSNYARHVREMGQAPATEPVWFWKPDTAIVGDGDAVAIPDGIGAVHHEVELAVRIGREARRVAASDALGHVDAFTVAVDVTARDLQRAAKEQGLPWTMAKGFDTFLPMGRPVAWSPDGPDLQDLRLRLAVGDEVRQDGTTADMRWDVASILERATAWTTLRAGDWVLTGTPEGVGPIVPGQVMDAEVAGHTRVANPIVRR